MRLGTLLLLVTLLALALFRASYGRFTLNRDAPLVDAGKAPVSGKPARRLLLIVLDGARADAMPGVPVLTQLAHDGAIAELEVDLPTISAAQYVSLLTGATPQTSGRRSNDAVKPVGLDSVPELVRRSGGSTAAFSDCVDWWWKLFPEGFDEHIESRTFAPAVELVRKPHDLVLVHFCAFDSAGHALGAASPAYRSGAALEVNAKVEALLAAWGDAGPVVVTSDHGHTDKGGHGGDEPEVKRTVMLASGPGVARGAGTTGRAIDVAPTVAALMGLPAPAASEGRTLSAMVQGNLEVHQRIEAADAARVPALQQSAERRRSVLEAEADVARVLRGASALALLLLVAALVRRRRRSALLGLLSGAAALVLTCAGYAVVIGPVSPSAARHFGDLAITALLLGLGASVLIVVPVALAQVRREGRDAARGALLAAAAGSSPLVAWMYTAYGLLAPRVSITSALAIVLPTLAWAAWAGMLAAMVLTAAVMRR